MFYNLFSLSAIPTVSYAEPSASNNQQATPLDSYGTKTHLKGDSWDLKITPSVSPLLSQTINFITIIMI